MFNNQWGQGVTAASDNAVKALDETLMSYLGLARETGDLLKKTLSADADMVMGHCLKGYFYLLMASKPLLERLPKVLAAAQAAAGAASPREQAHVGALKLWAGGSEKAAVKVWEEILADNPHDVLALRLAHHAYFYMGAAGSMLDSIENVIGDWDKDMPGYGFTQGMRAFALEETGQYDDAEAAGRGAIDLNPDDPWAVHAIAHVMEMQNRYDEGIEWITGLEPHWVAANNFRYHLWWHRALMHLGRGELDQALELYDGSVHDPDSDEYLDLCNDASLLIRLELRGRDVGERWQAVAEKAAKRTEDRILPFVDCHFVAALAAGGKIEQAHGMVDGMQAQGGIFADVGAPVAKALIAHRQGDSADTVRLLEGVKDNIVTLGGSHAQRDLFNLVLKDAEGRA
ncbi:MAG: tetratricopeptide repeat protein [Proteobacteria bacterium]|nr:tetratricopeptide repeat protein [Pseudomonadota bacterium]MDA1021831.1 tetratricopeptide repeat protein [Pseudomonadota bacterium]